jgi:hypothetical protein
MTQELLAGTTLEIVKVVVPTLFGGVLTGSFGAWLTMRSKMKEINTNFALDQQKKDAEAKAKLKLHYLDPLRVSTQALCNRLVQIVERRDRADTFLCDTIQQLRANKSSTLPDGVPYQLWKNDIECIKWANDVGHFVISTLRITALYLYHASQILQKLPYVELSVGDDAALRRKLTQVGKALGGPYGIWEELQDSLGNYILKENGSLMDYREFCNEIFHETHYLWFLRLIDFYGDIATKTKAEMDEMIESLQALDTFLKRTSGFSGQLIAI